jgi:hypothetical protein
MDPALMLGLGEGMVPVYAHYVLALVIGPNCGATVIDSISPSLIFVLSSTNMILPSVPCYALVYYVQRKCIWLSSCLCW